MNVQLDVDITSFELFKHSKNYDTEYQLAKTEIKEIGYLLDDIIDELIELKIIAEQDKLTDEADHIKYQISDILKKVNERITDNVEE